MNEDSTIVFADDGIVGSTTAALFLKKKSGPLKVIAKQGDPAPGVFIELDDMSINDDGDVAFIATSSWPLLLKPASSFMIPMAQLEVLSIAIIHILAIVLRVTSTPPAMFWRL